MKKCIIITKKYIYTRISQNKAQRLWLSDSRICICLEMAIPSVTYCTYNSMKDPHSFERVLSEIQNDRDDLAFYLLQTLN